MEMFHSCLRLYIMCVCEAQQSKLKCFLVMFTQVGLGNQFTLCTIRTSLLNILSKGRNNEVKDIL